MILLKQITQVAQAQSIMQIKFFILISKERKKANFSESCLTTEHYVKLFSSIGKLF